MGSGQLVGQMGGQKTGEAAVTSGKSFCLWASPQRGTGSCREHRHRGLSSGERGRVGPSAAGADGVAGDGLGDGQTSGQVSGWMNR